MRRDIDDAAAAAAATIPTAAAVLDLAIGLGFCVGIVAVYVPQHVQCWRHRTAQGLSLGTILLCTVSNVALLCACLLADADAIQKAYNNDDDDDNDDHSTRLLRVLGILNAVIPSLQNVLSIVTGIPTYIFYYFYFGTNDNNDNNAATASPPGTTATTREAPISSSWQHNHQQQHRWEVLTTAITWLACGTALAVTGFVLATTTHSTVSRLGLQQVWAGVAALTKILQWMPQIERTWTIGHEGVLSATSVSVGIVGDGLLAWFWRRSTTHESLWICATLGSDACMQLILLGLVLQYRRQRRRQEQQHRQDESVEEVEANSRETTTPTSIPTQQRRQRQRGTNIRWHDDDNDDTHAYNNIVDLRRPLLEDDDQEEEEEEEHCNNGGRETTTPVVDRNGGNLC